MKKRVYEISTLNVLFAMLVILIHVSSNPVSVLDKAGLPYMAVLTLWRLSSFVVQGFIFLSGFKMFYNRAEKFSAGKFYLSKVKNILFPYILWVIIFYFYLLYRGFLPDTGKHIAEIIRYIAVGDLVGHFYFIPVIMQFYLLAPLWNLIAGKIKSSVAVTISLIIMIVCFSLFKGFIYSDRIFTTYIFYFVAGMFAGLNYDEFIKLLKKNFRCVIAIFVIMAIANAVFSYINFSGFKNIVFLEYIHIAYCISAIFFCYGIALKWKNISQIKIVNSIDRASYYIYLIHPLFIFIIDGYMYETGIFPVRYTYPLRAVFAYGMTLTLCVMYSKVKSRIKQ